MTGTNIPAEIHRSPSRESGWFCDKLGLSALLTWTGVTGSNPPALDGPVTAARHRGTVMTALPYSIMTDVTARSYIHYALRRWVAIKQKPCADTWCARRPRDSSPARWKSKVQILLFALAMETTVKPCLGGSGKRDGNWSENSSSVALKTKQGFVKGLRMKKQDVSESTIIESESV